MEPMMPLQRGGTLLPGAAMLGMGVLVVVPVAFVLLQAVFPGAAQADWAQPLAHWRQVWQDTAMAQLLGNTVSLGVWVVLGCPLLGLPLGLLRGLGHLPGSALWDLCFLVPFDGAALHRGRRAGSRCRSPPATCSRPRASTRRGCCFRRRAWCWSWC